MSDRVELTAAERAALSAEDRALVAFVESIHDPSDDDERFGGRIYDDVLDEAGHPIV